MLMDKIKEGKGTAQRNTVQVGMSSFNKNFKLYALRLRLKKHPIQDPVRIYVEGCENGQTLATGCFKVTTRLPSWHGGWFYFYQPLASTSAI
jgi:hypothetical protein